MKRIFTAFLIIAMEFNSICTIPTYKEEKEEVKTIVIDAGHQLNANTEKEPIGPGSSTYKNKVSGGTKGTATGKKEYELNLEVALKLQEALETKGYNVIMIRTSNDVNISNCERAEIANKADADAFVRIHANGSNNPKISGVMTICQTENNPYNSQMYDKSYTLSACILEQVCKKTGAKEQYVWETDSMSGINWCTVPVTILEMGYMTNEKEDYLLSTEEYQEKIVDGIITGLEKYFIEY